MLSNVSAEIEQARSIEFAPYYTSYLMKVQDEMLDRELRHALCYSFSDVQQLVIHTCEEMKNKWTKQLS